MAGRTCEADVDGLRLSRRRARRRPPARARRAGAVDRSLDRRQSARLSAARSRARRLDAAARTARRSPSSRRAAAERYGAPAEAGRRRPRLAGADPGAGATCAAGRGRPRSGRPTAAMPRLSPRRACGVTRGRFARRARRAATSRSSSIRTIPTAGSRSRADLLDLHARLAQRGGWLIVDEAFADFDGADESLAPGPARARRGRAALVRQDLWPRGPAARLRRRLAGHRAAAARGARPLAGQRAGDRDRRPGARRLRPGSRRCARGSARKRRGSMRCWRRAAGASSAGRGSSASPRAADADAGVSSACCCAGDSDPPLRRDARPPALRHSGRRKRIGSGSRRRSAADASKPRCPQASPCLRPAPGGTSDACQFATRASSRFPPARRSCRRSSRALLDGELIDGFPGRGRAARAGRRDDLRADPARRRGARRGAARGERAARASFCRASRRSAPSSRTTRRRSSSPTAEDAPRPGLPPAVGALDPPPHAGDARSRMGRRPCAARSAAPTPTALLFDGERAGAGRLDPRAGLCARRRSRGADRRHDHRGRRLAALEDARAGGLRPYWRITLDFLKIAFAHWPQWLAEHGLIDRAKRVALLVEAEITALASGAPARPDHHRRLDRRQPRDRRAHRGDRPQRAGRGRAARPRRCISTSAPGR